MHACPVTCMEVTGLSGVSSSSMWILGTQQFSALMVSTFATPTPIHLTSSFYFIIFTMLMLF